MEAEAKTGNLKEKTKDSTEGMNPMRKIIVSKITLNIGAGKNEKELEKGMKLLAKISPIAPVKTKTTKRIPGWGLRAGLAIGCKATIRKGAIDVLKKLLVAKENRLLARSFDKQGNFSFGIAEYIEIPGLDYDPELKIMGLEVAVTLERKGQRVGRRKVLARKVGQKQKVSKAEAITFAKEVLGVKVE